MPDKLVNVRADTVEAFLEAAAKAIGEGDGVMGETTYAIGAKSKTKDGKIDKVTFELKVSVERAHWAGGKPDEKHKKAILEAEKSNKDHEEKHRKLAEEIGKKAFAKAEKALKGKDESELEDAVGAIKAEIDKAYADLDRREGMTRVTAKSDGSFRVRQVGR